MAIFEWRSSEKPVELPAEGYGTCCGETPEVLIWRKKQIIGVYCRNERCEYHETPVVACDVDIEKKWEEWRKQ